MAEKLDLSPVQVLFHLHRGVKGEVFCESLEVGPRLKYRRSLRVTSAQSLILEGVYFRISDGQIEVKSSAEFKAGKIISHSVEYSSSGQRVELKSYFGGWFKQLSSFRISGCKVLRLFGQNHVPLAYFVSSVGGEKVFPNGAVYCATKFAVNAFSDSIHQEFKGAVRCTQICPGMVQTGINDHIVAEDLRNANKLAYRIAISPSHVAQAICFALAQPPEVSINKLIVRPSLQSF